MSLGFSKKTFEYFDAAKQHGLEKEWFDEKRKQEFEEYVVVPMTHLVMEMRAALGDALPGVEFSARKITKPVKRQTGNAEQVAVRTNATAFFSERPTSMFEMNPGIYFSVGAATDDNVCGVGLYMPSSRQMKLLRPRVNVETASLEAVLDSAGVKQLWGGLAGERFKRFPKQCDQTAPGAEYLWQKQFFLSQTMDRAQMMAEGFAGQVVDDLRVAAPFLQWVRQTVGVYRKSVGE